MPDFIALIPARLASSRLPEKPLADLAGVPMVVRVARQAAASGASRVVVCADDVRILAACRQHGVESILTEVGHPSGTDRLSEAAEQLGLQASDVVVNVQADEPLIDPATIGAVARLLQARPECDIATVAHPLRRLEELFDPNVVKVVTDAAGLALLFSRAPIPWSREHFAVAADTRLGHDLFAKTAAHFRPTRGARDTRDTQLSFGRSCRQRSGTPRLVDALVQIESTIERRLSLEELGRAISEL